MRLKRFSFVLCLAAFCAARPQAAETAFNGSFESVGGGVPKGWTVVRGYASADRRSPKEGKVSLRLESDEGTDACVQSPPLSFTVGRRYEIRAWIRAERLRVKDLERTPIAIGAAVSLASAPFDVHSESIGGTRGWTQVRLPFTATRAKDSVLLIAGLGGHFEGRAWFDSISVDEISPEPEWPSRAAVESFGPGYRYPTGGWIYLHIEGAPYERGYQHGRLLAKEIEQYLGRCALALDSKSKDRAWEMARTTANALFLRGFDKEILQEMKGIADGAAAAGAKWGGRGIDLVDIAAANTLIELMVLRAALPVTPSGLEGLNLRRPEYPNPAVTQRCSAFAATGPATRDGKIVIGHITMAGLSLSEQTNIMLDVQPAAGHRVLMQSFPGGIQSGTDYYQNDAGIVLTETTIRQTPFNPRGAPVAFRARNAIQYGTDVGKVVELLGRENNGLYTNEWLIADAKNNEIAMYELGTSRSKLYRSSRNEWFGGTEGFYWGCNNTKDLGVRLEYQPDPKGQPVHVPFVPSARDIKWQELFQKYKGNIDEQFGFLAFRTAPLVSASSFDAKITTGEMASNLMCWAVFGKPNQREWVPAPWNIEADPQVAGIYSSGYRLFKAGALRTAGAAAAAAKTEAPKEAAKKTSKKSPYEDRLWEGWILPALDSELWLTAGSAAYYRVLRSDDWELELRTLRARFLAAAAQGDGPLRGLASGLETSRWFDIASSKGALLFDALRRELGDDRFFTLMRDFFASHSARIATSQAFFDAADKAAGKPMQPFFTKWLDNLGLPGEPAGPLYIASHLHDRLRSALLVYGTVRDAGANRYAAEQLQRKFLDWFESEVAVKKDFEVSEEDLQAHDVVFVGRPETNSALAGWKERIGLQYDAAAFRIAGTEYASEKEALMLAAPNPLDRARMVLVVAGNSALETVRLASRRAGLDRYEYAVYRDGKRTAYGFQK